jgi:hypothetical protein
LLLIPRRGIAQGGGRKGEREKEEEGGGKEEEGGKRGEIAQKSNGPGGEMARSLRAQESG